MKKKLILTVLLFNIVFYSFAQTSVAQYKVVNAIFHADDNGIKKAIGKFEYIGYLYIKDSVAISYNKPSFLKENPNGEIKFQISANHISSTSVNTDSIQNINKINFDSSEIYSKNDYSDEILKWKFEPGYQIWEYTDEAKMINGFNCQKAIRKSNGEIYQIVWFAPDIPVKVNVMNIQNLPGLAIEVEAPTLNRTYSLISFVQNIDIPDSVFNLKEFEGKKIRFVSYLRKPK